MAEKGNTQAKGDVPGQYRTAHSSSPQMGEFTSDTWQVHSKKLVPTTRSVITAQRGKSPAKRLGNPQITSRGRYAAGHSLWSDLFEAGKKRLRVRTTRTYKVMFLGRRTIQQKGWLGCSHPTLKAQRGPTRSSMQGRGQPLRISNWRVTQISGSSNTHLVLQKNEPHFFKRLLVCLKRELQTVS